MVQSDGEKSCGDGEREAKAFDPGYPEKITNRTRANARLIAAAPELYEALREILSDLKQRAMPDITLVEKTLAKVEE